MPPNTLNIVSLPVIAVAVLNPSNPSANAPAVAGFGCTVTRTGSGTWRVVLPQGFPLGSYVAAGITNGGPFDTNILLTDGDATNKFINTQVGGVTTDVNGYVIYYALPTEPLSYS